MNLLGAKKVSIGTMVELAWADASRKPVIACIEKTGNPHDSEYVRGLSTYVVTSLDEGIAVAQFFFNAPPTEMVLYYDGERLTTRPWIYRREF